MDNRYQRLPLYQAIRGTPTCIYTTSHYPQHPQEFSSSKSNFKTTYVIADNYVMYSVAMDTNLIY